VVAWALAELPQLLSRSHEAKWLFIKKEPPRWMPEMAHELWNRSNPQLNFKALFARSVNLLSG
jgi:phage terminase small subunit